MLSALIPSKHSYPAIHLVAKPVDQRFVQPGPLVMYFAVFKNCLLPLSPEALDYIFIRPHVWRGRRHISYL